MTERLWTPPPAEVIPGSLYSPARRRQAVVTAVDVATSTCTLNVAGDATSHAGINILGGYLPKAGDTVWCLQDGPDWLVLGAQQPAGAALGIVAAPATSTAATTGVTTTETKDGGVGDYAFTAVAGRRYRVHYTCRADSSADQDAMDVRVRDGGASSPTNASALVAGAEIKQSGTAGGQHVCIAQLMLGLSAGTHTVAAFYVRALGTGTVNVTQATGQTRELYVCDVGPA